MQGGHQEDAEEFLGFFLDTLEEELLSLTSAQSKPAEEPEAASGEGWLEVTKRNRAAQLRAVSSRLHLGQVTSANVAESDKEY